MPKYLVSVYWTEGGRVMVDAATPEEAAKKARDNPFTDMHEKTGAITETWEVVDEDIEDSGY